MSLYNKRINRQLMDKCLALPADVLTRETHSFFPNIISYWNHILFGDLILLRRIASNNIGQLSLTQFEELPLPKSPQDIYHRDITELAQLREKVDDLLYNYCLNLTEKDCEKFISYTTTEGELITKAVADVTLHLFNHQTHHRGQLTCVLSQFGIDYGCIDLPVIVPEGSRT